jgi:hypothetical protein
MKIFFVFLHLFFYAMNANARTLVEKSLSPDFTVTVHRINDTYWEGFVTFTTMDQNGNVVSNREELPANSIMSEEDKIAVVAILNRFFYSLHDSLAIPTPSPSPTPTPTPSPSPSSTPQ